MQKEKESSQPPVDVPQVERSIKYINFNYGGFNWKVGNKRVNEILRNRWRHLPTADLYVSLECRGLKTIIFFKINYNNDYNWIYHILFAVIFNKINFHEYPTRIPYQFMRMTETHTLPLVRPHTGTAIVKNSLFHISGQETS